MLSEKIIDLLIERLVNRIESTNTKILEKISEDIFKLGTLSVTDAHRLAQILKYGGSYNEITKELAELTKLNIKDIEDIFEEVAKSDYTFAKQFYDYKNVDYIPYNKNKALQRQVKAFKKITSKTYKNLSKTMAYALKDTDGKTIYTPIAKAYQEIIDKAVLSVSQGKNTFQKEMSDAIKTLGGNGIVVQYPSGYHRRLDTSIRMNMNEGLINMSIELQKQFGREFEADGVELTVHEAPAPDHADIQGHQFSNKEFSKMQSNKAFKDVNGVEFEALDRIIGQWNCKHRTFNIVIGISEPLYSKKQLQNIIESNNKGFELDGKHYTTYEGTQLQRRLETEIRRQKDIQILGKGARQKEVVAEAQAKITALTQKYKELSDISGLPTRMQRMRVADYRRINIEKL